METVQIRQRRRRGGGWLKWLMLLSGLIAMVSVIWLGWQRYIPNNQEVKPEYGRTHPIMVQGNVLQESAVIEDNSVKVPLTVLQQALGLAEAVYYEEKSGSIVLTNADKVLHLQTNSLTAHINRKPYELRFAAEVKDKLVYIPTAPLEEMYGIHVEYDPDADIVTILLAGESVQRAEAPEDTVIRTEPSIRAPIVKRIAREGEVRIWGEHEGWYKVQSDNGIIGYSAKGDLTLTEVEKIAQLKNKVPFVAWKVLGSKINMTWEAVYTKTPNTSKIGPMNGVNVVSPTWFELMNNKGDISSKADRSYVAWAHKRGMQVWGLFSNGFEPERTTQALATVESRFHIIQQILAYAELYKLQGINIDFENVHTADKANLVQFVRELTPLLHEQNLVVSIDVTPKSNSEMWSVFLDRAALGKVVDYMMVMAYDEHWASSPKAGSVASLPWVEQSILRIMEEDEVPPDKLVLGMPLYTRVWTEKKDENGALKVSSKALGMDSVSDIIAEHKLKPLLDEQAGQNYVEYTEDGARKRIWLEDELSIKARTALVKKYNLAGIATWQRAFQSDEVWDIIHQSLNKRP
ncbi:SH3 domain-containing protein [Paenibacillus oenotherae]|uniref:SH3 domain-containing protein n=1 Tax=Paenibacillus oenotherae TaxID=1435645 RepID=A0ABS7D957_9BACL|nr:SH3 domain-containing protein [Paenibacillus oenotherae]